MDDAGEITADGEFCYVYIGLIAHWPLIATIQDRAKAIDLFETVVKLIFDNENYYTLATCLDIPRVFSSVRLPPSCTVR